ncbi:patatin-like phospholipase family protein [Chloroflexota bacterium]
MINNTEGRKKIGLALSSGVARGIAHIGILEVFEREHIPVDMIAGTSIGALIGALYALGKKPAEIKEMVKTAGSKRFILITDLSLPKTGLIKGKKIEDTLKQFFGDAEFKDLKIPFSCVATDIDSGQEVIIDQGPLWQAIRATISLPVILAVAKWRGRHLVDGALVNPVPVNVVKKMGADCVIGVNVIPDREVKEATEPNIFDVIMQTLHIVGYSSLHTSVAEADLLIEPKVEKIALTDFHRVDECARLGEQAAEEALPDIRRLCTVPPMTIR